MNAPIDRLPSLAEDIEAEFGETRRPYLERLFSSAQLASLEVILESGISALPPADRASMKGRVLDDLLRRLLASGIGSETDRVVAAKAIIDEHLARQRRRHAMTAAG